MLIDNQAANRPADVAAPGSLVDVQFRPQGTRGRCLGHTWTLSIQLAPVQTPLKGRASQNRLRIGHDLAS